MSNPGPQQQAMPPQPPYRPAPPQANHKPALRVANAIAVIKWILIGLEVIAVLLAVVIGVLTQLDDPDDDAWVPFALSALGGIIITGLTWVLFGWFEQVLRTLVGIAENTRRP
ncbi:hypothetical protein CGZ95_07335 [Enemella evansiae]|uniref:hypothetical protein n=1 Tax=Enemella evansiae TaxID=2016499 RepID=UPI000B965EB1|nr:hypothetical protein [Enemella evansiae]OYO01584.1 hypothetical protein CGZ95_07335 [Enemella evansiae]